MLIILDEKDEDKIEEEEEEEKEESSGVHKFMDIPPDMQKDVGYLRNTGKDFLLRFAKVMAGSYL